MDICNVYVFCFGLEKVHVENVNCNENKLNLCIWAMKPSFLTDSFPEESLNWVYNNREKRKIEEKELCIALIVISYYVHS